MLLKSWAEDGYFLIQREACYPSGVYRSVAFRSPNEHPSRSQIAVREFQRDKGSHLPVTGIREENVNINTTRTSTKAIGPANPIRQAAPSNEANDRLPLGWTNLSAEYNARGMGKWVTALNAPSRNTATKARGMPTNSSP